MKTNVMAGQVSLFGLDSPYGKTSPAASPADGTRGRGGKHRGRTSGRSSRRSSRLRNQRFMLLDLRSGAGNILGPYWEIDPPWLGCGGTLNTSECPKDAVESSLSAILQDSVPSKYYLTRKACLGILRRAEEREKDLPEQLELALKAQAGLAPLAALTSKTIAFAANQRDEVRDLHDIAGALGAQPGMKQQTFIAQDCLTPWDTQQARIFSPEGKAPTLASADGGGGRNPAGLLFSAGVVSKGSGDCFLTPDCHTALSGGGGQPGQGYPCLLAAAFNAGAGSAAGTIGYQEEIAPTLKGTASNGVPAQTQRSGLCGERSRSEMSELLPLGKSEGYGACGDAMMPSVLCLNDQGGSVIECSENVAGTLRAQEHGHQPLVIGPSEARLFENHGIDARYTGPHKVSPTIPARAGTGGNNLPLVSEMPETLCILGNTVDCAPKNGGHGLGVQEDLAFTLTSEHRHAVFTRQRSDRFREDDIASTESAQQDKDATDLIYQAAQQAATEAIAQKCASELPQLIRRLTALECERLQGFPDGWTNLPGASDSARYRALGNSVAIPCVEFIMRGIAMAV